MSKKTAPARSARNSKSPGSVRQKHSKLPGVFLALFIGLAIVGMLLLPRFRGEREPEGDRSEAQSTAERSGRRATQSASLPPSDKSAPASPAKDDKFVPLAEPTPVAGHAAHGPADEEDSSLRSFLRMDFRNGQTPMEGFTMKNLQVTSAGITLAPGDPGSDEPRIGVMESPSTPFKHPSNIMVPIWRGEAPEGTRLQVEVTFSPDNDQWTQWFPISESHDPIAPAYPDGSPNPNYGAKAGTPVGFGLELYPHVRYRVTLVSDSATITPELQTMEFYHADTTMGEGFLAHEPPPDRGVMQAARSAFDQQQ